MWVEPDQVAPRARIHPPLLIGAAISRLPQIAITVAEHIASLAVPGGRSQFVGQVDLELVGGEDDVFIAFPLSPGTLDGHFHQELLPSHQLLAVIDRFLVTEVDTGLGQIVRKGRLPPDHRTRRYRQINIRHDRKGDVLLGDPSFGRVEFDPPQLPHLGEEDLRQGRPCLPRRLPGLCACSVPGSI